MTIQGGQGLMTRRRGAPLPYADPLSAAERRGIIDAIRVGLARVRADGVVDLAAAGETAITDALVVELNAMLDENPPPVPVFSSLNLETVIKGNELRSYNNAHIEKRPDMLFRPRGPRPPGVQRLYCGYFVECKIVSESRTMIDYCGDGLKRFLSGEYAWAMSFGMMLGFARDSYRVSDQFVRHLRLFPRYDLVGEVELEPEAGADVYVSVHTRSWVHTSGEAPGNIRLLHFWYGA